jgi:hypothetical protein
MPKRPPHGGDRMDGLVCGHELESLDGIVLVSRANQAAAFDRIARSSRSWRISRRSRRSSSRVHETGSTPLWQPPGEVLSPAVANSTLYSGGLFFEMDGTHTYDVRAVPGDR